MEPRTNLDEIVLEQETAEGTDGPDAAGDRVQFVGMDVDGLRGIPQLDLFGDLCLQHHGRLCRVDISSPLHFPGPTLFLDQTQRGNGE